MIIADVLCCTELVVVLNGVDERIDFEDARGREEEYKCVPTNTDPGWHYAGC